VRGFRDRAAYQREENQRLAPWAVPSSASRGRLVAEEEHPYRTAFQRDRDRIVHARAFRRLEYKTQVFVFHEGDHYRNRLTHTLETAQIARTMARVLCLNEDLAEAVALAHDLGHTPFGHAGERALNQLMREAGGFDHNRQTLRIVDCLEERDTGFRGLNLCYETREGILKHGADFHHPLPLPKLGAQPPLEAQVVDRADEVAYTNHDLDDGLRSHLIQSEQLEELVLWSEARASVAERVAGAAEGVVRAQTIRALIDRCVGDLIRTSARAVAQLAPVDVDALRAHPELLIGFSPKVARDFRDLKLFLYENLYHHPHVARMSERGENVLRDLWRACCARFEDLPEQVRERSLVDGEERALADYLAGMTDRFALAEHRRLFGGTLGE